MIEELESEEFIIVSNNKLTRARSRHPTTTKKIIPESEINSLAKLRAYQSYIHKNINVIEDEECFADIICEVKSEIANKQKIVEAEEDYIKNINKVKCEVFDLDFLIDLDLKEIHMLESALKSIKVKILNSSTAKNEILRIIDSINSPITVLADDNVEIWPDDKKQGENAEGFLRRVWGEKIFNENPIFRSHLRKEPHAKLYRALSNYFRRKGVPDDLKSWWDKSPQRTKEEINNILIELNIIEPEDAYRRGLPHEEAQKLYNAVRSRKFTTTLNK